tara:strand:+ start:273 stop:503 length:231 start_codon:yes stop_codon:yes gene_type:complete
MHIDISQDKGLDVVWEMILKKMGKDGKYICPNSSSFYKTQDGIECSLRKFNGDLVAICYRENNKNKGYRWTIKKYR